MDWNEDGKKDLILGENDGKVRIYHNVNTDVDPQFNGFDYLQQGAAAFDCGSYSMPFIMDWNNDGKKDVICGEENGRLWLMINEGTNAAPLFNTKAYIKKSGGTTIDIGDSAHPVIVDWDWDGKKDMVVGNLSGNAYFFPNIGTDANPVFNNSQKLKAGANDLQMTYSCRPDAVDWDEDGVLDLIIGEYDGCVHYFHALGPLALSDNRLHENTSGTINFTLDAGVAQANSHYFLLCGVTGTQPGTNLPHGLVLPCNWDFVSDLVMPFNNVALFFDFIGVLDNSGKATARFEWPGLAGSSGAMIYFAYCTYKPFDFVSNGASLEVVN